MLTTLVQLLPRLRMSGAISPNLLIAFMMCTGKILHFHVLSKCFIYERMTTYEMRQCDNMWRRKNHLGVAKHIKSSFGSKKCYYVSV